MEKKIINEHINNEESVSGLSKNEEESGSVLIRKLTKKVEAEKVANGEESAQTKSICRTQIFLSRTKKYDTRYLDQNR